jgi:hypothetical protein
VAVAVAPTVPVRPVVADTSEVGAGVPGVPWGVQVGGKVGFPWVGAKSAVKVKSGVAGVPPKQPESAGRANRIIRIVNMGRRWIFIISPSSLLGYQTYKQLYFLFYIQMKLFMGKIQFCYFLLRIDKVSIW